MIVVIARYIDKIEKSQVKHFLSRKSVFHQKFRTRVEEKRKKIQKNPYETQNRKKSGSQKISDPLKSRNTLERYLLTIHE